MFRSAFAAEPVNPAQNAGLYIDKLNDTVRKINLSK